MAIARVQISTSLIGKEEIEEEVALEINNIAD
jgi:hypothetical protein